VKIQSIKVHEVTGNGPGSPPLRSGTVRVRQLFLEILTDEGLSGFYGPIDLAAAMHVTSLLEPELIGMDPLPWQRLWYGLLARHRRHGWTGAIMMAIASVDNTLWDLRGKAAGVPVYKLLGGPTRDRIRVYASMGGFPHEPAPLAEHAQATRRAGFTAQKWFFDPGPRAGRADMVKDLALVRNVREAVGDDYDLMFDATMHWDADYAIAVARDMLAQRPTWLEEPVPAMQMNGYVRIKQATGIPLAGGEHLYSRWDVRPYLEAGAVDFVQADPEWAGGISELTRICAMAAAYGVKVCPHGHTIVAAAHVIASQPESVCPIQEYLFSSAERRHCFLKHPLVPEGGALPLPSKPGLGVELDEAKIESRREVSWRG